MEHGSQWWVGVGWGGVSSAIVVGCLKAKEESVTEMGQPPNIRPNRSRAFLCALRAGRAHTTTIMSASLTKDAAVRARVEAM
jgi:hypothetical protein